MTSVITTAEVNDHNKRDSLWLIIHGDVYDVTKFIEEHPGGEDTLLDAAGSDATDAFEDVGHSEDARELLKKYKIGTLPRDEKFKKNKPTKGCESYNWKMYALAAVVLSAIVAGVMAYKRQM